MFKYDTQIDDLLKIIREAETRNYSELVLKSDLDKFIYNLVHKYENSYEELYDDLNERIRDEVEDEVREDAYNDGYSEGETEGKREAREEFIELVANKMIELKSKIRDQKLTGYDLQLALTEFVIDIDSEEDHLCSTTLDDQMNDFDNYFCK